MAATTSRGFHAPTRVDAVEPNVTPGTEASTDKTDVALLAHQVDGLYLEGALADLPAAAFEGRIFQAADTGDVYLDRGSSWLQLGNGRQGTAASRPGSMPRNGMTYYATDTGDLSTWYNGAWSNTASAARVLVSAGTARSLTLSTPRTLPLGTLSDESVAGVFSKVTHDTSGHAIRVAVAGLYRVSVAVSATGDASVYSGAPGAGSFLPNSGLSLQSSSLVVRVAANDDLYVQGSGSAGSTWTQTVAALVVERVGP